MTPFKVLHELKDIAFKWLYVKKNNSFKKAEIILQ